MISVTRPLDYEQIPKGIIYLTVMAIDGGNPAFNSTVSVTVEVIVSTFLQNALLHTVTPVPMPIQKNGAFPKSIVVFLSNLVFLEVGIFQKVIESVGAASDTPCD